MTQENLATNQPQPSLVLDASTHAAGHLIASVGTNEDIYQPRSRCRKKHPSAEVPFPDALR